MKKSTVEEIRARFDQDVERFSNLETGQSSTVDAPLAMSLIAEVAVACTPEATEVLDIGCGAGNYSLRLLQEKSDFKFTLVDLSQPMLDRAGQRLRQADCDSVTCYQADVRTIKFEAAKFDIIVAASTLHHLRDTAEWQSVFTSFFDWLSPGGSVWIFDLVVNDHPQIQEIMWRRYGEYLSGIRDDAYRDTVFRYIEQEDTPRSLDYQINLLQQVGFERTFVLHKSLCFAAFGAVKH